MRARNITITAVSTLAAIGGMAPIAAHAATPVNLVVTTPDAVTDYSQLTGAGAAGTIKDSVRTSITQTMVTAGTAGGSAPGITVTGSGSTDTSFIGDRFRGGGSAVVLTGGSSGTTIADDEVRTVQGPGFAISDSTGDMIVGDTVRGTGQGVVATGGSTGLTIADDRPSRRPPRRSWA